MLKNGRRLSAPVLFGQPFETAIRGLNAPSGAPGLQW